MREYIKKLLEFNENESMIFRTFGTQQGLVLRGKFIAMTAYIKNTGKFEINDLLLHFKLLEKNEQAKTKISRMREIIKIGQKSMMFRPKKHTKDQRNK
jgi:hypothetical protein